MNLYRESPDVGVTYRQAMLDEVHQLIIRKRAEAHRSRAEYFQPRTDSLAAYETDCLGYRQDLIAMLGWPLPSWTAATAPLAREEFQGEDDLGKIYRLWIETLPGITTYGLFFVPHGSGPFPLVIAQHGGLGTPELCSGLAGDTTNYNDMVRRVLRRGVAVFAPQLLLWSKERGPAFSIPDLDKQLKQLGGSLAALEIFRITQSISFLAGKSIIDGERIGMIGLSYGGFYTQFCAAIDPRIKVAVSSCFYNDRFVYDWPDWTWLNSGNQFLDAEVASLICPRPLFIEIGQKDELFRADLAHPEIEKLARRYAALGKTNNFVWKIHPGGHELDREDDAISFLAGHLGA